MMEGTCEVEIGKSVCESVEKVDCAGAVGPREEVVVSLDELKDLQEGLMGEGGRYASPSLRRRRQRTKRGEWCSGLFLGSPTKLKGCTRAA